MNLSIELQKIIFSNIYFLEPKRNIILDGFFTKITYSNELLTMNGLYVIFPVENITIDKLSNKNIIKFNPYSVNNLHVIQDFSKIEYRIIEYYKTMNRCNRKTSNLLSKQMYSGKMKVYKEMNMNAEEKKSYVIKISGVWESKEEVGITYKLIEVNEYCK